MPQRHTPEIKELTKLVGHFIQYWGFKKIHGQIWAYIFLSKQPIDSTTLYKRLGVSKALVSLAIKDLIDYKVIRVAGPGARRKILLEANPDQIGVILDVLKSRERLMLARIKEACDAVHNSTSSFHEDIDLNSERLEELTEMVETAQGFLEHLITINLAANLAKSN